ncbi:glycerophosphoryl diester phosphodiesterase [Lipingzhangella halophila]|uniref:Glycerophosphoryl diester phosphodiesterase n=1 Tax=Lipingzhangella halophila TaxID=1783352 RepID=A0A7W7RDT9_9ACTN|nr:glycerophosphodiester phosphodiesterase family protein [Lipingzhangella halophila]MBB4930169.1 glycerophosphoryl diester phosphodiesterase [Lipingzhangella halophila]
MFQRLGIVAATAAVAVVGGGSAAVAAPDTESTAGTAPSASAGPRIVTDVAHRGASGYAPENTLAAIDEANEHNATTAEVDVQRSSDGALVVIHDTTLERTTDVEEVYPDRDPYDVADFTLGELRELDAGSWFDGEYADEPIPTLEEVLDRMDQNGLNLLLEIKSPSLYPGIESDIADTIRDNPQWLAPGGGEAHRLVIQSFDWESVERSSDELPQIPHGLLGEVPEDEIADYAAWADQINPNHTGLDADYVDAVHDAGLEVFPYTLNDAESMRSVIGMGADGIISDYPDIAREVIEDEDASRLPRSLP